MKSNDSCVSATGRAQYSPSKGELFAKMMKIMRLITFFLLSAALQISASGLSQKVTITGKKIPLEKVFAAIEKQSGYSFLYKYNDLRDTRPVDLNMKNVEIREVLDACLTKQHLIYTIEKNIIAIKAETEQAVTTPLMDLIALTPEALITGTIRDEQGERLPGVTVLVKGTQRQVVSNERGEFSIQAEAGQILVFTSVGYALKTVTLSNDTNYTVVLSVSQTNLSQIVITALGVSRSKNSLTYATQQVSGEQLTTVKTDNLVNALSGKVAGLNISSNGSGIGGSAKVILRGSKSLLGNNQALYVIDGVPVNNSTTNQPTTVYGGSLAYDGGDPISTLNPDDIQSISVLKGASAAALYGSQGANGVIVITTKSGKAGRTVVGFSSSATFDKAAYEPSFQNSYGPASASSLQSWGNDTTGTGNNLDKFFQTGNNFTNSVNLSAGTATAQTYFSYANTTARGIEPNNKLQRNNFNFRETGKFFHDKLTADVNTNYVTQRIDNSPMAGFYFNPLTGLYLFPRGVNILPYKTGYEALNPKTLLQQQQWIGTTQNADGSESFSDDVQQNPWWIINRNLNTLNRNRVLLNASLKYDLSSWLNIQARGSIDRISDTYDQKLYATSSQYVSKANGNYYHSTSTNTQQYGDLIANFNFPVTDKLKISGLVGTSIRDTKTEGLYYGSSGDNPGTGLYFPNIFTLQNTITDPGTSADLPQNHIQFQSVFGSVSLAYNEALYLDLTARNDWASPLTYTAGGVSFFYPSIGANAILSKLVSLPEVISFAKVRASYAEVGNAPLPYQSHPAAAIIGSGGSITLQNTSPFSSLAPEDTKSFEAGATVRFMNDRLGFDLTYYDTKTHHQTIQIQQGQASFYDNGYLNAGAIQNQGVELIANYDVIKSRRLTWNTSVNYSFNKNKVLELAPGIQQSVISGASGANYVSQVKVGGSIGDIYGTVLEKDTSGRILMNTTTNAGGATIHTPLATTADTTLLGNPNPKWQLGWNNSFTFNNIVLSFTIDGKFGGKVLSVTQQMMDSYGVSAVTGAARKAGGVSVNGIDQNNKPVSSIDAQSWYSTIGGRNGVSGEYMYDATTVRLREAAIGYNIPFSNNIIKSLKVSLIGRNLVYFSKKAPFDPELTLSTGNQMSGVDLFMPPATRSFGISVNASF